MGKMKNMVVLKDVKSNLIDEAIIVFKENISSKQIQYLNKIANSEKKDFKGNLCVEEAQKLVATYIEEATKNLELNSEIQKIKRLKIINIMLVLMLIVVSILKF